MRCCLIVSLILICTTVYSQEGNFPFGKVTYRELDIKSYEKDTSAYAVVLDEFGEAYFDNGGDHNLMFEYHVKIKILKQKGVELANIEIPLRKSEGRQEKIIDVNASSFTFENGSMRETKLDSKKVYTENVSKYWDVRKFAIPNVRVGSVIEYKYVLESPFIFNFRSWEFQTDYPKIHSEYWAKIPANYKYNISLRGFYKLTKEEAEVIKDCFTPSGSNTADCILLKWTINDIPAFIEEDHMTARSNFLSAIYFELSEYHFFDGRKDKITKEWKDAEDELRKDEKFGRQLKRGKEILDGHIDIVTMGEDIPLNKAQKIYDFIKFWYRWNDVYGIYSEFGIKKAFDTKVGNVGDINLSLVAALRYAGFQVEPILLSTRRNGQVTELYPVISEFNYVIARLTLDGKSYLLDATDDFLPFGSIPERCLNGKGRLLGDDESSWVEIKPVDKEKNMQMLNLQVQTDGTLKGTVQLTYFGYDALQLRKEISNFSDVKEYIADLDNKLDQIEIVDFKFLNLEDLNKQLVINLTVDLEGVDILKANHFLFNPFLIERWEKNPFRSSERLYPVDFGAPLEEIVILNLTYPTEFKLSELPAKVGLQLPNSGGRYIYEVKENGNVLSMQSSLLISKAIFSSAEYHYLKELFNQVIAVQHTDLVFERR